MDLWQLLIFALVGIIGGLLSGLVGVGGGIFFVPALVYGAGWDIREAVAVSLMIVVFSSLSGTIRNSRSDDPVDWRVGTILSLASAPASLIGVYVSRVSPEAVVQIAFASILLMLVYSTSRRPKYREDWKKMPVAVVFPMGICIGAISGLVGVGGGILMVPLMVLGMGLRTKQAISTSLAVALFTGLVGAAGYIATGFRDPEGFLALPPLIASSMIGAWTGVRFRDTLPEGVIRTGFGIFMIVVALRIFAEALGIF